MKKIKFNTLDKMAFRICILVIVFTTIITLVELISRFTGKTQISLSIACILFVVSFVYLQLRMSFVWNNFEEEVKDGNK